MRSPNYDLPHVLEAKEILEDVVARFPTYAEGWTALGIVRSVLGAGEDAMMCWHRALELRPNYAEVYGNIGTDYALRGDWEKAIECYRQALEIRPDVPVLWINLCIALARTNNMREAEAAYDQVKLLHPNHAQLWRCPWNLGRRLEAAKVRLEAARLRIELLETTPNDVLLRIPDAQFLDLW